jgi:uncharacterized repeat protein (TIGR01451 family)
MKDMKHSLHRIGRVAAMASAFAIVVGLMAAPAAARPNIVVEKTAGSASIEAGEVASFTITVSNTGTKPATGVTLTDPLPGADLAWSESPDVAACSITDGVGGDTLSCTIGTIAAGGSFSVTVVATTSAEICDYVLYNTVTVRMPSGTKGAASTVTASASISVTCAPPPPPPGDGCTLTQGFWKNHYPEAWPAGVLANGMMLGTVSYTAAQLVDIFDRPVQGNGLVSLAHQLIAAKLNIASGANPGAIQSDMDAADAMIGGLVVPPIGSGNIHPSNTGALTDALDDFNNGVTGPGHCDDD